MIYKNTRLLTLDNTGALIVEIIRVLKSKYEHGKIGDVVVVAVKTIQPGKKVKRGEVKKGVIVQTKKKLYRKYMGSFVSFNQNSIILFGRGVNPLGTRIKGCVARELRSKKYMRILTMAPSVI